MIYDPLKCAVFFKTREKYGELSNMRNGLPLEWEDRVIYSSEALYQAHKFYPESGPFKEVISQKNSMISKMMAKEYRFEMRNDWAEIKLDVMNYCLRLKYYQHRELLDLVLDETLDLPIVEKSRKDRLWGAVNNYDGRLEGENILGNLWMIIRDERPSVSLPLCISSQ